ncbi:type II toxin-antitoxin system RelE/ParE family toxin [Colidextribacter sp. OB.20]|uniref:type II toxin-antitoxin system RelE/ParE family toxin n=1 Tax=Colidextribacter sp. OB.20 TaxID=2304568 RepID=UPI00136D77EB|nr:type II toxin-antitoxin system RelE/ParE family toxin [Colidextribacter sp. OB.20]NBI11835.1 type II toxin-antitoxin system RelE/ParE family toxin [Colidextribacter sp. OB.20]
MSEREQYRLVISKRAAFQLRNHAVFAARLEERLAQRLMSDFQNAAEALTRMPFQAPYFDSDILPRKVYRKLLFGKRYLMLYKVQGQTIYIEFVADCRQDDTWLLQ